MLHNGAVMTPCRGPGGSSLQLLPQKFWEEKGAALAMSTAEGEVMVRNAVIASDCARIKGVRGWRCVCICVFVCLARRWCI